MNNSNPKNKMTSLINDRASVTGGDGFPFGQSTSVVSSGQQESVGLERFLGAFKKEPPVVSPRPSAKSFMSRLKFSLPFFRLSLLLEGQKGIAEHPKAKISYEEYSGIANRFTDMIIDQIKTGLSIDHNDNQFVFLKKSIMSEMSPLIAQTIYEGFVNGGTFDKEDFLEKAKIFSRLISSDLNAASRELNSSLDETKLRNISIMSSLLMQKSELLNEISAQNASMENFESTVVLSTVHAFEKWVLDGLKAFLISSGYLESPTATQEGTYLCQSFIKAAGGVAISRARMEWINQGCVANEQSFTSGAFRESIDSTLKGLLKLSGGGVQVELASIEELRLKSATSSKNSLNGAWK